MSRALLRRSALQLAAGAGLLALGGRAAGAAALAKPSDTPVLTVSGKITQTNDGDRALFDRAMLEALGMEGFVTQTPWYKHPVRFDGVRLGRLMQAVGAHGDRVLASALNDYSSELPIADFAQYGTLLALKRDGQYMPVSDKGPLFIVYPFDSNPQLQQDKFYMRSVWQVSGLEIR